MPTILHIDMDAFFAAVEVLDHPEWAGKPLVVGSPPDKRGVVCTASYEARKFGIRSAMPSRTAYRLCPHAIFAPVRMSRYIDLSGQIMNVLQSFTPLMEQVSVDEAFLDITSVLRRHKSAHELGDAIKRAIRKTCKLTASVGVGPNKFLAKLASDLQKPDGLTILPSDPEAIIQFLAPLPVTRIWGVGKVTEKLLAQAGIRIISDIQAMASSVLVPIVGPALAEHIHALAHGRDDRTVVTESEAKSISAETTFDDDLQDRELIRSHLIDLIEQVGRRVRASALHASTISIKMRFDDFQTMTRQMTLASPVCSDRKLIETGLELYKRQQFQQPLRLIGFGVSGFSPGTPISGQLDLFEDPDAIRERRDARLDGVVDRIREKMGRDKVRRGSTLSG